MKFLGIRNHHDTNVTYTDGQKVTYIKLERNLQDKHYCLTTYDDIKNRELEIILKKTRDILDINLMDLDAIAVSLYTDHDAKNTFNTSHYHDINELHKLIDKTRHTFWNQFKCPVFSVDHHWAHALSCWPLVNVEEVNTHFVIDAMGDHNRYLSFFNNGTLAEFLGHDENQSFSMFLNVLGKKLHMSGLAPDHAGKLMALKASHKLGKGFIDKVFRKADPFKYRHLYQFISLVQKMQKETGVNPEGSQSLIDLTYLIHQFAANTLPDYFHEYLPSSTDVFTFSGGTAQNTVINTSLRREFPNMIIPPHCPDDGISLGCVEFLRQKYQQPHFDRSGFPFWQTDEAPDESPSQQTIDKTAELLAQGKIVGWYQGHGEIGSRALGNRSILMDPSIKGGKDIINNKVKHREEYRPFGASVLLEHTENIFDCVYDSPYMLYNYKCKDEDRFHSIVHTDGTCRIQTVGQQKEFEPFHNLINTFSQKTGIPMLLNTSLNVNGKPIAGKMEDAKTLYENTELDALVIGNQILVK